MAWCIIYDKSLTKPMTTKFIDTYIASSLSVMSQYYNMIVYILAWDDINFSIAADVIMLNMPCVK